MSLHEKRSWEPGESDLVCLQLLKAAFLAYNAASQARGKPAERCPPGGHGGSEAGELQASNHLGYLGKGYMGSLTILFL